MSLLAAVFLAFMAFFYGLACATKEDSEEKKGFWSGEDQEEEDERLNKIIEKYNK